MYIDQVLRMANRQLDESWDRFRYFLAVARTGTLLAAATQLRTEHTTVSRHIRILEDELKTQLFHRSNQGYELTEAGRRLLLTAEVVESAVVSARAAAVGEQRIAGTVRVGAPDGFGTVFLAPRLGALARLHPLLDLEIFATPRLFSLSKREADIVIGLSVPEQVRVVSWRLTDYRLFVYGSRAYLDAALPIFAVEDMKSHPIISYVEEMAFTPQVNYLSAIGPEVQARIRSTSLIAQAHAALGGAGLCILPAFIGSSYPLLVPVLPEKVSLTRSFHMHIHEDHKKAAHVRAVASFIASEIERNAALFHEPDLTGSSAVWNLSAKI
jgi:DNA-binding transcriptional LysR family regulator